MIDNQHPPHPVVPSQPLACAAVSVMLAPRAMKNPDTEAARSYHEATKHSDWSVRHDLHALDWANEPLPFKIYPTLQPLPLPQDFPLMQAPALSAISQAGQQSGTEAPPDLRRLAALLYFSAGITKRRTYPGRVMYYRAAACTGAL